MSVGQLVDQNSGQVFPLDLDTITLGRHVDNTIVLSDSKVSRFHAEIMMQGGRWVIRDLGSANGTYVNGQRIGNVRVLQSGDVIGLGDTLLRAEWRTASPEQDTLAERLPPAAEAAPARARTPWLAIVLALLLALALVAALLLWPRWQRGDTPAPVTPTASLATPTPAAGLPPTTAPPTAPIGDTAQPTVAAPTLPPTLPPPQPTATPAVTPTPAPTPAIGRFRAETTTVEPGQCARLTWSGVQNAHSLTLSGVGRVNLEGKLDVCPDDTRTYTLEAAGPGGAARKQVKITVRESPLPTIEFFRVAPAVIAPGECAQLEWGKVDRAESATIEPGIGGVGTPGTVTVCPQETTTYVLKAANAQGVRTAETVLSVTAGENPPPPVIAFFTASPTHLRAGECTELSWGKVDYAAFVSIDQGIGGVGTPGSREVCPAQTTTFILTAVGFGGTVESRVTVQVTEGQAADLPDLVIESILFDPNPCYRGQKCKVQIKVRNDGSQDADHFVVRWAPAGEEGIPVEWDVDRLAAGASQTLTYPWIPSRAEEKWWTLAIVDLNDEVGEVAEGAANILEQWVTVSER